MISPDDARMRRMIALIAQILQAFGSANTAVLLKVLFSDNSLISAGKRAESPRPSRVEIG
jgi:hypothetical protein